MADCTRETLVNRQIKTYLQWHSVMIDFAPNYSSKKKQPEMSEYRHRRQQRREVTEEHHGRRHHSASGSSVSSATRYEVTSTAVHSGSLNRGRDNYIRRHERHPSLETFKPNNSGRL